jgi:ubiquinone/menaquinone biosynthesis C-methylase UbiE
MEMFTNPQEVIAQFDIVPGMTAADMGAGSGHITIALSKAVGENGVVLAVEIQKEILDRLRGDLSSQGIGNVELMWGDIEHPRGTKIKDFSVDRAVMSNTMFQLEDRKGAVTELSRILKPDGKVLFVDWSDSHGGMGPVKEAIITPDTAKDIFESNNFTFDHNIVTGEHHYGMVFRKKNV